MYVLLRPWRRLKVKLDEFDLDNLAKVTDECVKDAVDGRLVSVWITDRSKHARSLTEALVHQTSARWTVVQQIVIITIISVVRRITPSTDDHLESAFLFQRLSTFQFNATMRSLARVPLPTQSTRINVTVSSFVIVSILVSIKPRNLQYTNKGN